ncbi:MAG: hypothetical protein IKK58_03900 [Clostridia bacterium]|nr:hypothetical protein [Clostridia bacterium]
MKKFLMILFVAVMSIMLVVPAFAEGAHDDKIVLDNSTEINLKLMDNFKADTSVDSMLKPWDDGNGATAAWKENADGRYLEITTAGAGINSMTYACNGAGGEWSMFVNSRGEEDYQLNTRTKAYVFKVNTTKAVNFAPEPQLWDGAGAVQAYISASGDPIVLVGADGVAMKAKLVRSAWSRYTIHIPANFDGFVIVPTSRFTDSNAEGSTGSWNAGALANHGYIWYFPLFVETCGEYDATLNIEDIYYVCATDSLPDWGELPTATADVSVIAYAVAAITGLGALVVAKKR